MCNNVPVNAMRVLDVGPTLQDDGRMTFLVGGDDSEQTTFYCVLIC